MNAMPDRPRSRGSVTADELLLTALDAAVPLHIVELRTRTPHQRQHIASEAATAIGSQGDILMFGGGGKRGEVAAVFNHLAAGLAAAAYAPGGVTFAGRHWCVDHAVCTGDKPEPPAPATPERRPLVDLELPA